MQLAWRFFQCLAAARRGLKEKTDQLIRLEACRQELARQMSRLDEEISRESSRASARARNAVLASSATPQLFKLWLRFTQWARRYAVAVVYGLGISGYVLSLALILAMSLGVGKYSSRGVAASLVFDLGNIENMLATASSTLLVSGVLSYRLSHGKRPGREDAEWASTLLRRLLPIIGVTMVCSWAILWATGMFASTHPSARAAGLFPILLSPLVSAIPFALQTIAGLRSGGVVKKRRKRFWLHRRK